MQQEEGFFLSLLPMEITPSVIDIVGKVSPQMENEYIDRFNKEDNSNNQNAVWI
ncbi:unnamed protein product, partial [Ceratitis capitata]